MRNEEIGERIRRLYSKYIKIYVSRGYEAPGMEDFLEWIDSQLEEI